MKDIVPIRFRCIKCNKLSVQLIQGKYLENSNSLVIECEQCGEDERVNKNE